MIRVFTRTFQEGFCYMSDLHKREEHLAACTNKIDRSIERYIRSIETIVSRYGPIEIRYIDIKPLYAKDSNAIMVMVIVKLDDRSLEHDKNLKLEIEDYFNSINYQHRRNGQGFLPSLSPKDHMNKNTYVISNATTTQLITLMFDQEGEWV